MFRKDEQKSLDFENKLTNFLEKMVLNLEDVEEMLKDYPNEHVFREILELQRELNVLSKLINLHQINQKDDDLNEIQHF